MSESNPSLNIGGNAENVTIIVGNDNQSANSNEQHPNEARSTEIDTSESAPKPFSVAERRVLRQTLNALPLGLFEDLVYDLAVPAGIIPGVNASQKDRCRALLAWSENTGGIGLAQVEELLIPMIAEQSKSAQTYLKFVIEGETKNETIPELQPVIQLLRQITGDDSIDIAFVEEGSIRIVLSGSSDGLKKLQELYDSGELETLDIPSVETVQPVDNPTAGDRKARLVQVLKLRGQFLRLEPLIDRGSAFALYLYLDISLDRDLDFTSVSSLASALDRALASVSSLARTRTRTRARTRARALASSLASARASALDLAGIASALDLASHISDPARLRSRASARASALNFDLTRANTRALNLVRALDLNLDLTDADLRGTNLRNINFVGVYLMGADLTGADLTGADVQGTVFGDNEGLSELVKRDLEKRGAIFQDPPGSDVPSLVRV